MRLGLLLVSPTTIEDMKLPFGAAYAVALLLAQGHAVEPAKVEVCALTERPSDYDGQNVDVRARLTELKHGEWALDGPCFRPILVVLRADSSTSPEFSRDRASVLDAVAGYWRRGEFVEANFIGRFEWSGSATSRSSKRPALFGRSQVTTRLVLKNIADVRHFKIPKR
jgi:hypothetical protein